jgi:hypothetical protein
MFTNPQRPAMTHFSTPVRVCPAVTCNVIGLDLGKLSDFSALAALKWTIPQVCYSNWKPDYEVPTLHRWPLGTSYKDIVAAVLKFQQTLAKDSTEPPYLIIDGTGVGEAVVESVVEQFGQAKARGAFAAVTITAGNAVTQSQNRPGRWNVAKKQLVSILQVLLGMRRLHVAQALEHARVLQQELETFQVKVTEAGNETFESWRERDHDDLVLAVALACWAAESLKRFKELVNHRRQP